MIVGVIPARLHSTRFPRKILALIDEKPMIIAVAERAALAQSLDRIIIAIDDPETKLALKPYEFETVMTSPDLASGTDRIGAVMQSIDADVVVNIQGDEPLIEPAIIDALTACFLDPAVEMATAVSRTLSPADYVNPNIVKAFLDENRYTFSFKRMIQDNEIGGCYKHLGIYAYTRDALLRFIELPPGDLELQLRLEQWRALENGMKIRAVITDYPHHGVDTMEDLEAVRKYLTQIGTS